MIAPGRLVVAAAAEGPARAPTKGPSRLNADGSSAEDDVRTTPVSDTPGRGQAAERAYASRDADRYGRGTAGPVVPHYIGTELGGRSEGRR